MVSTKSQLGLALSQTEAGKTPVGDFSAKTNEGSSSAASELTAHEFSSADLETAIWRAAGQLMLAVTYEEKCRARDELKRLHRQRTPEAVERMERARGLRL